MPTRSLPIASDDLAGLAALANNVLLPQVNALVASSGWSGHAYTVYSNPPTNTAITNPQPPYVFDLTQKNWLQVLNRIRADYYELVFNVAGSYVYQSPAAINSGPWVVSVNDPATFPFGLEINGVQQISLFPDSFNSLAGVLLGAQTLSQPGPPFGLFNTVRFYCGETDSEGLAVTTGRRADFGMQLYNGSDFQFDIPNNSPSLNYTVDGTGGQWTCEFVFYITGPAGAVPAASIFSPTATPSTGVTWKTFGDGSGAVKLVATVSKTVAASTGGSQALTVSMPSGYSLTNGPDVCSKLIFSTATTLVPAPNTFSPRDTGNYIAAADVPAASDFYLSSTQAIPATTIYSSHFWAINNPAVKGFWTAKTFPQPALNVYLDPDIPPFVNSLLPGGFNPYADFGYGDVAVSSTIENLLSVIDAELASLARMQADFKSGSSYQTIDQATQRKATTWPVLRDTDFVPFDLGFNQNIINNLYTAQTAPKSGVLVPYSMSVAANAKAVKFRLVQNGTTKIGWTAGLFGYGTAITTGVTIYAKVSAPPTTSSYDYKVVATSMTLPAAVLAAALGGAVNIAVQNNNSAADLVYDLQTEEDIGVVGRSFFPPSGTWECFSYAVDGTPYAANTSTYSNTGQSSPIPQNGHQIFKVRITRLPVTVAGVSETPTTGAALVVYLGQNKLQFDGSLKWIPFYLEDNITPFSVTIPANARDSGDVDVFWPVLEGNELVYRCASQVIIEPSVTWQPKFNFYNFGIFAGAHSDTPIFQWDENTPGAYQYCLSFMNWYDRSWSGYPADTGTTYYNTRVQYPFSIEIYNDLVNSLLLLPAPDSGGGDL